MHIIFFFVYKHIQEHITMLSYAWFGGDRDNNKKNPQFTWGASGELIEGFDGSENNDTYLYTMMFQLRMNDSVNKNYEVVDTKLLNAVPLSVNKVQNGGKLIANNSEIARFYIRERHQKGAPITFIADDMTNYNNGQAGFPLLTLRLVINKDIPEQSKETLFVYFPGPGRNGLHINNRNSEMQLHNVYSLHVYFDLDTMV